MCSKLLLPFPRSDSWRWLSLLAFSGSLIASPVSAQVLIPERDRSTLPNLNSIPREPQSPSTAPLPEQPSPQPLPAPAELLQPPAGSPPAVEETPGNVPATIRVTRFEVIGSTVFSSKDFAKITEPYTQRPISLADLFEVRSKITELYVSRGYVTSGAYIPPQQLQEGTVKIRVVEGALEAIKVTGTRRLNPNYVKSRIAIATRRPLNRTRLLEALQLLQLNPLIKTVSAELSAGTRPGESLLELRVTESRTLSAQIVMDNSRSPSVGSDRRQLQLGEANVLGLGDSLSVGYTNTKGSNAVDLSYVLPLNPRNGTVSFSYGSSSSNVIEQPFNVLDIESKSRYYELTLRQPIAQSPTQELAIGLTASHRESEATLLRGIPFPAVGADAQGKTRISALRFFQDYTKRSSQDVLAFRSQFSVGLNALGATINDGAPDSRFLAWRGQAQYVRLLASETLLLLKTDVQLADRPLVPLEQIGLGGQDSVRGYRQDLLLTDNSVFASAEVRLPVLRLSRIKTLVQLTPFLDFGSGTNRIESSNPEKNTLVSVGFGLRLQVSDRVTARFDWGMPLVSVSGRNRTWQEDGLYFSVVYNTPF